MGTFDFSPQHHSLVQFFQDWSLTQKFPCQFLQFYHLDQKFHPEIEWFFLHKWKGILAYFEHFFRQEPLQLYRL